MPTTKKEVAVAPQSRPMKQESDVFSPENNLAGVKPRFPKIILKHAGTLAFQMPGGALEKTFAGIILDISNTNAFFEGEYTGDGEPPTCTSIDGLVPDQDSESIQSETCAKCPKNAFGSDPKGGKGKACNNRKRIFILLNDAETIPTLLFTPASSIAAVENFQHDCVETGEYYQLIRTGFSITAGKQNSSKVVLTRVSELTDEAMKTYVEQMYQKMQKHMRAEALDQDDYEE